MSTAPEPSALALAEAAYDLVQVRPNQAEAMAERALALAKAEASVDAQVVALHALAWSQRVRGDPQAIGTARAGIRIGERQGADRRRLALLRRLFAVSLADSGSIAAARSEIDA